jgi:amino acid adenylation domain-containing protein
MPLGLETDPAYLLYTSGSTGTPKGVILSHRNALTFVDWAADSLEVGPDDRLSNHAPHHFDLSVFDIYAASRSGACVVLVPDAVSPFPMDLARWIDEKEISIWYSVPSALIRLLLHGKIDRYPYKKLRSILFAGEVFPVKYLRDLMKQLRHADFFNWYGPTETNVCTYYKVPNPLDPSAADIPIGKACGNTEVFAVDGNERVLSPGKTGELYVTGPSVMLGYWGLRDKTAQVLQANPFEPAYDQPLYRTGDIVRLEPDGNYGFIGRKDHMVKSRGHRIELGEIEQVLYQHELVREAVVVAVPDDEIGSRLKAFVAPNGTGSASSSDLQSFCLARLPKYMVPEAFILKSELPKTSTGKIDRVTLTKSLESDKQEAGAK